MEVLLLREILLPHERMPNVIDIRLVVFQKSELLFRILRYLNVARSQPPSQKSEEIPVKNIY
jgi:hypothetical protein